MKEPSLLTVLVTLVQFVDPRLGFCSSAKPVEGNGDETMAVFVVVSVTVSVGAPGVCTAAMMDQNPPSTE